MVNCLSGISPSCTFLVVQKFFYYLLSFFYGLIYWHCFDVGKNKMKPRAGNVFITTETNFWFIDLLNGCNFIICKYYLEGFVSRHDENLFFNCAMHLLNNTGDMSLNHKWFLLFQLPKKIILTFGGSFACVWSRSTCLKYKIVLPSDHHSVY